MIDLLTSPLLRDARLVHGFTTRVGGVSEGSYASLNITRSRGDSPHCVAENRERLRARMGVEQLVFATQVHGRGVIRIEKAPAPGHSAGEGDALITDQPGLGLVCQTADCTPILLFDPQRRAIAAIHSGWRSTVQNIVSATISTMRMAFDSQAADIRAVIGPAISPENYRVGPEVIAEFEREFADLDGIVTARDDEGGGLLDVSAACWRQLRNCGLAAGHIDRIDVCTYAEPELLFSARRSHHCGESGVFGGQGGVIALCT